MCHGWCFYLSQALRSIIKSLNLCTETSWVARTSLTEPVLQHFTLPITGNIMLIGGEVPLFSSILCNLSWSTVCGVFFACFVFFFFQASLKFLCLEIFCSAFVSRVQRDWLHSPSIPMTSSFYSFSHPDWIWWQILCKSVRIQWIWYHMLSTSANSDGKQNYCIRQDQASWNEMQTIHENWM